MRQNIDFAKNMGISPIDLWGIEWWYWMKEKHDRPEFWNEAKRVYRP
jgi:L-ribulose-5-phosphate 3-epimerase UlaE